MCLGAIKWLGIKEIYYAMDKDDATMVGIAEKIFVDDTVHLIKHKINDETILEFMQVRYQQQSL